MVKLSNVTRKEKQSLSLTSVPLRPGYHGRKASGPHANEAGSLTSAILFAFCATSTAVSALEE
jgi:hypothetical protein